MKAKLTTLLSIAALSGGAANAAIVVDWGGDYVATSTNYGRAQTTVATDYAGGTGQYKYIPWSESTALNPSSGYTAPSGKSGTFYGGMFTSATGTGLGSQSFATSVVHNTAGDRLNYRSQMNASTALTGRNGALGVAFLQSDFLNGLNTGSLTVDVTSSVSMSISIVSSPFVGRFMIKNGSQWYVSNTTYTTTGSKTLSGLASETWATFNPATNLDFNNATFNTVNWTDITGVGYYADYAITGTSIAATDFVVSGFSANLAAVPEPGAALLGGLGLLALLRRRRA